MRIEMPYDCLKKPFAEMTEKDLDILSRYMGSWWINNAEFFQNVNFSGTPQDQQGVDTVVLKFMKEFNMQESGFDEVRRLFTEMVTNKNLMRSIDRWYFDNCPIGRSTPPRFTLLGLDAVPDEVLDCMMAELNLPAALREKARKELWQCYRDDFEMWCSGV